MTPSCRVLVVLAAASAAPLLAPAPASAAVFAGPVSAPCVQEVSALGTGTVFGAGTGGGECAGQVQVSRRDAGGSFRRVGAWPGDARVLDVAADLRATFVVLARPGAGSGEEVLVGKVPHGGRPSALTLLGSSESGIDASVTAVNGRWAAAWTETVRELDRPGSGRTVVRVRGTLLAPGTQQIGGEAASQPSIDWTGTGAVLALVEADQPEPLRTTTALIGERFATPRGVPQGGRAVASPEVDVSGETQVLSWVRDGRPVVQVGRGAAVRVLPQRGEVQDLQLAVSGGSAFVVTTERFSLEDAPTSRAYARDVTASGVRSTTEVPLGPKAGDAQVSVTDVTAARGRATVVTRDAATTRVSTSR